MLTAKRLGPFEITKLIGKNAVKLHQPDQYKIPQAVNVSDKTSLVERVEGISADNDKTVIYSKRPR